MLILIVFKYKYDLKTLNSQITLSLPLAMPYVIRNELHLLILNVVGP